MQRQNDTILKEELSRSVGVQYATGDQWRNNSRKNEETEPKQNQHLVIHSFPTRRSSDLWVFFLLWLHLFILSGVISPLIYSSILGTYRPGEFIFQHPFSLFILFMGFSGQEYWSGFQFPSPVDHILSELSTMTHLF